MEQTVRCLLCHRELEGAIEVVTVSIGRINVIRLRETSDCNWTRCKTCKRVICKNCYQGRPISCCETAFSTRREEIFNGQESTFKKAA